MATSITTAVANSMIDALGDSLNSGTVRIYSGSVPANVSTALSGQTILAELALAADAFATASNGTITANAITDDTEANASGTATFFRVFNSGGTAVLQGAVGTSGTEMTMPNTSLVAGGVVTISSMSFSQPTE